MPPAPLAAYSCDAGYGDFLSDDSGNGHYGTLHTETIWTENGHSSAALSSPYAGIANNRVSVDRIGLEPATAITLMAWVKINTAADQNYEKYKVVIAKPRTGSSDSYGLYPSGSAIGYPLFALTTSAGNVNLEYGTNVFSDGNWHHIAGTWDGILMTLYVDGTSVTSAPLSGTITYDNAHPVSLLGSTEYLNEAMLGDADDIRIYDAGLTSGQINSDMFTPVTPLAAWSLWDGASEHRLVLNGQWDGAQVNDAHFASVV